MSKISPVGHPEFTSLPRPSMYNYSCFKTKDKSTGVPNPKQIFTMWLHQMKSAYHKSQLPQKIHQELPPTNHIELGLNYTKLWYVEVRWQNRLNYHSTQQSTKFLKNCLDNPTRLHQSLLKQETFRLTFSSHSWMVRR